MGLKVSKEVLKKVVDYCTHYREEAMQPIVVGKNEKVEEIVKQQWYMNFIKEFKRDELFPLIQAANYLDIQPLLSLSVLALCAEINNKSETEIRGIFNIPEPEKKSEDDDAD